MIDIAFLKKLIEAVESSGIDTLEISRWGTKIRITKSPGLAVPSSPGSYTFAVGAASAATQNAGNAPAAVGPAPAAPASPAPPEVEFHEIVSPMVGTFYRAPAPDAPPYVEVGQRITKGQTLCILEAMKLMNELQSELEGVLREICVEDGEPVEYGQVLFRVERD